MKQHKKQKRLETRGQNVNSRSKMEINMIKFFTKIVHEEMSNSSPIN